MRFVGVRDCKKMKKRRCRTIKEKCCKTVRYVCVHSVWWVTARPLRNRVSKAATQAVSGVKLRTLRLPALCPFLCAIGVGCLVPMIEGDRERKRGGERREGEI